MMTLKKRLDAPMSNDILALMAGAFLTLSFAPFHIYPLAILSPALLLSTWLNASPRRAFYRGWLFGAGLFSTGVYWVFISIHEFGDAPIPLAALITCGFIALLALFPAYTGYFLTRYFPRNNAAKCLFAFPALWVLLEWVRSWIFTGFPWLLLGYSQTNSFLKAIAPIYGIYGVSLAVVLCSALIVTAYLQWKENQKKRCVISILAFLSLWVIAGVLNLFSWTTPDGHPIKVSLVQGNIPQAIKWSPESIQPTLKRYMTLTEPHWDSQIIIWPEAAIPITLQSAEDFLDDLDAKAKKHHTSFLTGIPIKLPDQNAYYNSIVALGDSQGYYLKRRLVPFGEFVPMRQWVNSLFDILHIPMSDFVSGPISAQPLQVGKVKIAPFICYEIAFPELVRTPSSDIGILLTVSNDAWFGDSIAQPQHLETAQMRAIELGRPVLFVSNDGITAIIDAHGKIQSAAPQHTAYVLTGLVQPMTGRTPWQKMGMDPILVTVIALLIFAIKRRDRS